MSTGFISEETRIEAGSPGASFAHQGVFSDANYTLGGGVKYFYFHPDPCKDDPIWLISLRWVETAN